MPMDHPDVGRVHPEQDLLDQLKQHIGKDERFPSLDLLIRDVGYAQPREDLAVRVENKTALHDKESRHTKTCSTVRTRTLSGTAVTNSQGKGRVRLNDYFPCIAAGTFETLTWEFPTEEVAFTATAVATRTSLHELAAPTTAPSTLTIEVEAKEVQWPLWADDDGKLSPTAQAGKIVDVHVLSWDASGKEAPHVRFHWICVARSAMRTNIPG
jgi:hypothetical protein